MELQYIIKKNLLNSSFSSGIIKKLCKALDIATIQMSTLYNVQSQIRYTMSAAVANPKSQMAEAYVQKHRIPELFENMTAALIHTQPGYYWYQLPV